VTADLASIRRFAGIALVTGLSCAAVAAVIALLTGSFSDGDARVILTSIGFAITSATGSAGAAARLRASTGLWLLGTATLLASVFGFLLLLAGLWTNMDNWGDETVWRAFGCIAVLGVAGAHSCVMLGALRSSDTEAVRLLTLSAVGLSAFDTLAVILPLLELVDDVDETWARIFGASLVLLILTSVLPSILRRIQPAALQPSAAAEGMAPEDEFLATAVIRIADRIELLNSDPGNRAPEIHAEVRRLRKLAESFET
jgi:hypothetical protein